MRSVIFASLQFATGERFANRIAALVVALVDGVPNDLVKILWGTLPIAEEVVTSILLIVGHSFNYLRIRVVQLRDRRAFEGLRKQQ